MAWPCSLGYAAAFCAFSPLILFFAANFCSSAVENFWSLSSSMLLCWASASREANPIPHAHGHHSGQMLYLSSLFSACTRLLITRLLDFFCYLRQFSVCWKKGWVVFPSLHFPQSVTSHVGDGLHRSRHHYSCKSTHGLSFKGGHFLH